MKVVHPIPKELLKEASVIYAEAFSQKALWIIGPRGLFEVLLQESLNPKFAYGVVDENGSLLGVAGFKYKGESFLNIHESYLRKHFSSFSSKWRYLLLVLFFNRWEEKGVLLMDGIAVTSRARGMGVGTLLIHQIIEKSRELDLDKIRLDVIDENPRAKKLYERFGFKTTRHLSLPFLKKLIGVTGVSTMIKKVNK